MHGLSIELQVKASNIGKQIAREFGNTAEAKLAFEQLSKTGIPIEFYIEALGEASLWVDNLRDRADYYLRASLLRFDKIKDAQSGYHLVNAAFQAVGQAVISEAECNNLVEKACSMDVERKLSALSAAIKFAKTEKERTTYSLKLWNSRFDHEPSSGFAYFLASQAIDAEGVVDGIDASQRDALIEKACGKKGEFKLEALFGAYEAAASCRPDLVCNYQHELLEIGAANVLPSYGPPAPPPKFNQLLQEMIASPIEPPPVSRHGRPKKVKVSATLSLDYQI